MSFIPTDYLYGSFEFETKLEKDAEGNTIASAAGYTAKHRDQSQAINDLNVKLNDAMERGELTPGM